MKKFLEKNGVEQHRPFPGPKLLALDCRQEKAKLEKEKLS